MNKQSVRRGRLAAMTITVTLLVTMLLILFLSSCNDNSAHISSKNATNVNANYVPTETKSGSNTPLTLIPPPDTCGYCNRNLVGASSKQIGQVVLDYARAELDARGTTQLLLVRSIAWGDMPELGLGCLPDFASIEDPPLALVILKGDFNLAGGIPGAQSAPDQQKRVTYVIQVLDLWPAGSVYLTGSQTGGILRRVLNDPSLPAEERTMPTNCFPRAPRTLHYGQTAGGVLFPTKTG
jgi:hypothetical protein